jgi:hypothetical protein
MLNSPSDQDGDPVLRRKSLFAANVYLQDELRGVSKVEPEPRRALCAPDALAEDLSGVPAGEQGRSGCLRGGSAAPHLAKVFRMIFLSQMAKQLPWNDILNKK